VGKNAPDAVQDAALDYIDQANIMHVCSAEPANYAGIAAVSLADVAMTPDTDFTKAAGTVSGRKVTVAAKSGVTVDASGTATHIVLARTTDSSLRYVTTCTSQALTAGNTVNIPAWEIEIQDPT
jgi:hypothetical protein